MSRSSLKPQIHARTDPGLLRGNNEDALFAGPPPSGGGRSHGHLLLVADGMGGMSSGEVASTLAAEALPTTFFQTPLGAEDDPAPALKAAFTETNLLILREGRRKLERMGMGCTCTAALLRGDQLWLAHVGDSRAYLLRDKSLKQLTRDHTLVQKLVDEGEITPDEAKRHKRRHVLLRAMGTQAKIEPDLDAAPRQVLPTDRLLLCSDGLTAVLDDSEIAAILLEVSGRQAVDKLVDEARRLGGPDNITVLLLEFEPEAAG